MALARADVMKRFAVMLAVIALLAALGSTAASAAKAPSTINVAATGEEGVTAYAVGTVESTSRRCIDNRKVKLVIEKPGERVLFDVARTGRNGGWQARGPASAFEGSTGFLAVLVPRAVKTGSGRVRCGGDEVAEK